MKKNVKVIFFFLLLLSKVSAQNDDFQSYMEQGVKLYDNGNYNGAIEQYQKALLIDKESLLANYEISSSYYALTEYKKAIEYIDKVIDAKSDYLDQAYILKGSALDLMGNKKEAIKTYKEGIKVFPKNHLFYYNIALTYYNMKEYEDAENALINSLKLKTTHASSHLLLGYIAIDQGCRVKSLLALYNFLLLEPEGKRAKTAYKLLETQLRKGVKKENNNSTTITLSSSKENDEFRSAELMISLLEASKDIEIYKNKTEYELFADNTKSFFSILGGMSKDHKGFWWDYYVDFYYEMEKEDYVEAFCYYITQSREDGNISTWLHNNSKNGCIFEMEFYL